ncbi:Conserved_hypothetical protein [Hexamita inflata]|uniref:N-acetyltransferase domain-containing protein n=1 Tax=Hexamita inflata TaxID=28002 RepID=A0AA86NXH7_9EUKA|nr:Conserved hypothetical protein [Hexamita inflata]
MSVRQKMQDNEMLLTDEQTNIIKNMRISFYQEDYNTIMNWISNLFQKNNIDSVFQSQQISMDQLFFTLSSFNHQQSEQWGRLYSFLIDMKPELIEQCIQDNKIKIAQIRIIAEQLGVQTEIEGKLDKEVVKQLQTHLESSLTIANNKFINKNLQAINQNNKQQQLIDIKIRNEISTDYRKVEEITREAFWNLYCPGCAEHLVLHNLRKHKDFIKELSFVIEVDGEISGSIHYSKCKIVTKEGQTYDSISFGPVCIAPKLHRRGLGRTLIEYSMQAAKQLGYQSIFIGGYPYHYHTYGFIGTKKYGIALSDGNYYTGIMALPLCQGALDNVSGTINFSEIMVQPDQNELIEFDNEFPYKEKKIEICQQKFEKAVSEIDTNNYEKQSALFEAVKVYVQNHLEIAYYYAFQMREDIINQSESNIKQYKEIIQESLEQMQIMNSRILNCIINNKQTTNMKKMALITYLFSAQSVK